MDSVEEIDPILTELSTTSDDLYLRKFFECHSVIFHGLMRDETVRSSQILDTFRKYCEIANASDSSISSASPLIIQKISLIISEIIIELDNLLKTEDFWIESSVRVTSILERIAHVVESLNLMLKKLSCGQPTLEENIDFTLHFGTILYVVFKHCHNYETIQKELPSSLNDNIRALFVKSNQILDNYFKFIQSLKVECGNNEDLSRLIAVVSRIFSVGVTVSSLDLKTMALFWKCFLNLLKPYASYLRKEFDLSPIIEFFYEEIYKKIKFLYEDTDSDSRNLMLKVLCFLVRVTGKLCCYWSGYLENCVKCLLQLIFFLYDHSVAFRKYSSVNLELIQEVDRSLLADVDSLVSYLINDSSFIQNFSLKKVLDIVGDQNKAVTLLLLNTILQKLISCSEDVRELWFQHSILNLCFTMVSEFHETLFYEIKIPIISYGGTKSFREIFLYDALLVNMSSLIVCNFSEKLFDTLEVTLMVYFLRSSILVKILISDLWCIIVRYGNSELCLKHIKYLLCVLEEIQGGKTEATMLLFLIRRLFHFLTPNHQIHLFNMVHDKSLIVDFMKVVPENQNVIRKALSEISYSRYSNPRFEDNVKLLKIAAVIGRREMFLDEELDYLTSDTFLVEQWAVIVKIFLSLQYENLDKTANFIFYLSLLTASRIISVSQANVLQILKFLQKLLLCESILVQLSIQKILRVCGSITFKSPSVEEFVTILGSLFRICLRSRNSIVRLSALESFSYFSHITIHESIIQKIVSSDAAFKNNLAMYLQKKLPEMNNDKNLENFILDLVRFSPEKPSKTETNELLKYETRTCDRLVHDKAREAKIVLDDLLKIVTSKHTLETNEKHELSNLFCIVDKLRKFI